MNRKLGNIRSDIKNNEPSRNFGRGIMRGYIIHYMGLIADRQKKKKTVDELHAKLMEIIQSKEENKNY